VIALPFLGPDAVFDHVGLAVRSIADIAGHDAPIVDDSTQRVSVSFVDLSGLRVELIQPLGERSPIDASLKKGQPLVHLCFRVPSLESALEHARRSGLHQLARPVPAPAFDGRRIAWLFSKSVGLIELLEAPARMEA
jgi:methylmalonyl-CoA/ethylmalonyl-CoA epimerase